MSIDKTALWNLCRAGFQAATHTGTQWQILRFCCVGAANVLVDFCVYVLFLGIGMPLYAARSGAWAAACIFSYLANRAWTFKAADTGLWPVVRFFAVNAFTLCLAVALLYLFTSIGFGEKTAFFLSLPATMASNFLGYKLWTFKKAERKR